ncbi:type III PLP-dependent enzyme [Micromonospora sp. WMMD956]|uniref:type III PLP-dependent enzyme n=1 Tax=Micromonospora sp. WMMD956 TaxID=3016108 RepID=UPI002417A5AF|nr:type III PLP-dependent enzyme [Micromonospora sp. WMMD956]MDG4816942.1 type III PLP-dependent enzyme [Micromonospora sp. WMMD956]
MTDTIGGLAVTDLAREFGTPLYVYDADVLRERYRQLREVLHPEVGILFSLKANPNVSICAVLRSLGAGAEVSSLAELLIAGRAGVAAEDTIFLGPGKSAQEIDACLATGVHAIVCESWGELAEIDALAARRDTVARVVLRINPSFTVKGSRLTMSGKPRQFGIDEEQALEAAPRVAGLRNVRLIGVHVYMGTRILAEEVAAENTIRILDLAERVAERLGFELETVDVGGGLGVAYFDGERDLDLRRLADLVNPAFAAFRARHPRTRLFTELGRFLTAESGTYVVRVRQVKESMGEWFAVTDGGTHHHMAAVGVGSFVKRDFPIRLLGREATEPAPNWRVTGLLCTPNDTLSTHTPLPPLRPGDLLGVLRSGAYGPSASPVLFLSHGHPAEVLVDAGRPYLIRDRDRPADIVDRQRLYERAPEVPSASIP